MSIKKPVLITFSAIFVLFLLFEVSSYIRRQGLIDFDPHHKSDKSIGIITKIKLGNEVRKLTLKRIWRYVDRPDMNAYEVETSDQYYNNDSGRSYFFNRNFEQLPNQSVYLRNLSKNSLDGPASILVKQIDDNLKPIKLGGNWTDQIDLVLDFKAGKSIPESAISNKDDMFNAAFNLLKQQGVNGVGNYVYTYNNNISFEIKAYRFLSKEYLDRFWAQQKSKSNHGKLEHLLGIGDSAFNVKFINFESIKYLEQVYIRNGLYCYSIMSDKPKIEITELINKFNTGLNSIKSN
jgi:hypothetical protein